MKFLLFAASIFCASLLHVQSHSLQKLWETDTTLAVPESVLPDVQKGVLYASLVAGDPWAKDGVGYIAQISTDGKIINDKWVTGLNAPKGMGIWKDKLYAADVTDIAVIDRTTGKITGRIAVSGAENLNDITVDNKGVIYVSDSKNNTVYRIENGNAVTYLTNLSTANGVKAIGDELYILTSKEIYKADATKKLTKISELEHGGDGIEPIGNGDFVVTSWSGYVYYLHANGKTDLLLDTHDQHKNTADIGYNPTNQTVYVPTFFGKSVVAYSLK